MSPKGLQKSDSSETQIQDGVQVYSEHRMRVIKRDGCSEPVSLDKVQRRIQKLSDDLDTIDPIVIAQKVCAQIYDGVRTSELDELAANLCTSMITEHPDYGILGSRIIISNNQKNTSPSFSETMEILYNNVGTNGEPNPLISKELYEMTMKHKNKLNDVIDYDRDFTYDYFAFKTLERGYLFKINGKIVERIQHMVMRVSLGLHIGDLGAALKSYEIMSGKYFTHATPTLYHAGTENPQLLSCFLLAMEDSIRGIYKTAADIAQISKWAGGIGVHVHDIRSKGSLIRGTNGSSDGIIPMLRVLNATARYVNQSGRRKGSFAIYLSPWHPDTPDFLDLRKNHGNEEERCRDLFTAMWISDLFMERVDADADWSLLDPDECPGLSDAYGDEFKALYEGYEAAGKARKVVKARDLWRKIIESQIETGTPYMLYKDSINRKNNQSNVGTIRSSNLCSEIVEYSDPDEYACCTLASMALPRFVETAADGSKWFNFEKLVDVLDIVVNNLNIVIDLNYYPVPETELSNKRHRPLGIGVQGLADVYIMMGYAFDSDEALQLNREIFEALYYGSMCASVRLAKRDGPYSTFEGSPLSQGKFQFDLWAEDAGLDAFQHPSNRWDWDALRSEVIEHGARNSLLVALMPTASTSQILGNNECIEPYTSNIYARRTLAGDFALVNKHLARELLDLGIWNPEVKNMIIANGGSIQNIDGIPDDVKARYKTVWEIKQKFVVQQAADRSPYVCQSQSMNLFFEDVTFRKLNSAHFAGWRAGLKTGSYYIRTRAKVRPQQFTIDPSTTQKVELDADAEAAMVCSLTNRAACEMCSA